MILQQETFEPVVRPRVMELLERVMRRRIGLVVASAGYGKSVAVSQYLLQAKLPAVRFVVRDEHTKPLSFAWGLARALSQVIPGLERGLLGAYESAATETDPPRALAAWFAAQLDDFSRTVVVDDLHLVLEELSVRSFILALIERAPTSVRWILLSRSSLDLPLTTWLAYGHADEPVLEGDLCIRPDEAAAIARAFDVALRPGHLEELLGLTAGWPAAFIFALRAAARGAELGQIALETREKLYAYLADQAFAELSPSEQQFLLGTALLPVVDLEQLAAAGWDEPEVTYERLRRSAGFIVPQSATTFHYHDLFRDFLQHRLRLAGAAKYRLTQLASAALLEASDRRDSALRLRAAAKDRAGGVRMLRVQASSPTLHGMVDAIDEALLSLPKEKLRSEPALLGLLARVRVHRGAYDESDALYRTAIDLAETTDQRAMLTLPYARSLFIRRGYDAEFAALRALDANEIENSATRIRLLSRLAMLRAMRGEFEEAQRLATESLESTILGDPDLRAEVLYYAAMVAHFSHRSAEAPFRVAAALKAAEQSGNSYLIARCCHSLSLYAINDGDWEGAARLLAHMLVHAKREGDLGAVNHTLQTALALGRMRGDYAAIDALEATIGRSYAAYPDAESVRSFARAMLHARTGDFQAACDEVEAGLRTLSGRPHFEMIFDLPHAALYHAAAGDRDAALRSIDRATAFLTEFSASGTPRSYVTLMNIGRVLVAVAHAVSLRSRAATEILSQLKETDKVIPAVASLAQAAHTFNRVAQGVAERAELDRDLMKVRAAGLDGYADLLAALPIGVTRSAAAFGTLTKAEMHMLRLIARGGTMKAIAVQVNRSPDTVETHIRAILRKLGCKSRSEAVALARDHGII